MFGRAGIFGPVNQKRGWILRSNPSVKLARPAGIEPTTPWFVAKYSIQLSYGRERRNYSRAISETEAPAQKFPTGMQGAGIVQCANGQAALTAVYLRTRVVFGDIRFIRVRRKQGR